MSDVIETIEKTFKTLHHVQEYDRGACVVVPVRDAYAIVASDCSIDVVLDWSKAATSVMAVCYCRELEGVIQILDRLGAERE